MMRVIRSVLVFCWIALSVIPAGLVLLLLSLFVGAGRLWWWIAVPWLRGAIAAARLVGGVRYRVQGWEHLPGPDGVAVQTRQATTAADTESALLQQAIDARDSAQGVNLDEEAANLLRYQQAYQAAAQVIAVADEVFQTLLAATRR